MKASRNQLRKAYEQAPVCRDSLDDSNPQYVWLQPAVNALVNDAQILDAGAGNGRYANAIRRNLGITVDAFDLTDRPMHLVESVRYFRASIDAIPLREASYDMVYCFSVLYYLKDTDAGVREFYRVLRPGGRLVFSVHTRWSLFSLLRVLRRWLGRPGTSHLHGVHFRSAGHYIRVLERCGFIVERVDGWRLSWLIMPLWRRAALWLNVHGVVVKAPGAMHFSRSRFLARLRAEIAYHAIFTARKPVQGST